MPREPETVMLVSDFAGLVLNADPTDVAEGAAENQVNACCMSPGELTIRQGIKVVSFEEF